MSSDQSGEEEAELQGTSDHAWYVLHVKAKREKYVASSLRLKGYTEFLPLYLESRRWSDRVKKVQVPLFRGYVFCRFDAKYPLPILKVPGVISAVGKGGVPEAVAEAEITSLQTIVASGLLLQPWPFLEIGEQVIIQRGPLRHVQGILLEIKGDHKLIVSVRLLQRSVAVQIERTDIRPVAA